MNQPLTHDAFQQARSFDEEARQLAEEEHNDLAYRRERLPDWKLEAFDQDYRWRDDFEDFFNANRNYFLEQAREQFSEGVRV